MKKNLLFTLLLSLLATGAFAQSLQKVLIEEHTGAWCGYCPDGARILEDILVAQPNAIGVSLHNSDAMYISTNSLVTNFYSPAFPQATINRQGAPISRGSWSGAVNTALQKSPVLTVAIDSAGYDFNTRQLKVKMKATFLRDTAGTFRVNLYLTEDNVTGSGSGYDQVNYYNSTVGSPFYGLGNPIVGYVHNHVLRVATGGAWGTGNSIPSVVTAGEEVYYTFSTVLSSNWDINNMHIVAMVNGFAGSQVYQRPTLNSEEIPFSVATSIFASNQQDLGLEIYPNPVRDRATISFELPEMGNVKLEVYNLAGQKIKVIADDITNSGMHSAYWDGTMENGGLAANGLYLVKLSTEQGGTITKRLLLAR